MLLPDCTLGEELQGQEADVMLGHLLSCNSTMCVLIFFFIHKFFICFNLVSVKGDFHVISKYLVSSKEAER